MDLIADDTRVVITAPGLEPLPAAVRAYLGACPHCALPTYRVCTEAGMQIAVCMTLIRRLS